MREALKPVSDRSILQAVRTILCSMMHQKRLGHYSPDRVWISEPQVNLRRQVFREQPRRQFCPLKDLPHLETIGRRSLRIVAKNKTSTYVSSKDYGSFKSNSGQGFPKCPSRKWVPP